MNCIAGTWHDVQPAPRKTAAAETAAPVSEPSSARTGLGSGPSVATNAASASSSVGERPVPPISPVKVFWNDGVILCRINIDGSGFTVLRAPVPVPAPQFTNNLNFSPLWPQWR